MWKRKSVHTAPPRVVHSFMVTFTLLDLSAVEAMIMVGLFILTGTPILTV